MATYKQALANCWVSPEVLCMEETQGNGDEEMHYQWCQLTLSGWTCTEEAC